MAPFDVVPSSPLPAHRRRGSELRPHGVRSAAGPRHLRAERQCGPDGPGGDRHPDRVRDWPQVPARLHLQARWSPPRRRGRERRSPQHHRLAMRPGGAPVGQYTAGRSGRISKIDANGHRTTFATGFPSGQNALGDVLGVADVAFLGGQLYALSSAAGAPTGSRTSRPLSPGSRPPGAIPSSPS
jgi:hypothetical protein